MIVTFAFACVLVTQSAAAPVADAQGAPAQGAPAEVAPAEPALPKLLVLDTKSGDLSKDQTESLTAIVAARAAKYGQVEVTSTQDVRELAQVEAEKQAAGCDGESCLSEIAGAMGAQYVLATRAGKIGSSYVVSVQLYDANKGSAEARDTAEAFSVDELPAKLTTAVDGVLSQVLGAPQAPRPKKGAPVVAAVASDVPAPEAAGTDGLHLALQITGASSIIAGGLLSLVGVTPLVLYNQKKGDLNTRTDDFDGTKKQLDAAARVHEDALQMRELYNGPGRILLIGGVVLVIGGAGALAAGFFMPPLDSLTGDAQ